VLGEYTPLVGQSLKTRLTPDRVAAIVTATLLFTFRQGHNESRVTGDRSSWLTSRNS